MATPLVTFKSHIEGKNADVTIWHDRIEWERQGARRGMSGKALVGTMGLSALASFSRRGSDTNVIPIRAVQGVTTHKAGMGYTTVEVTTGGDRVAFRVSKGDAEQVKDTLLRLMQEAYPVSAAPTAPAAPAAPTSASASLADELRKLAQLRDQGVLSDEEFQAQKARLLGQAGVLLIAA